MNFSCTESNFVFFFFVFVSFHFHFIFVFISLLSFPQQSKFHVWASFEALPLHVSFMCLPVRSVSGAQMVPAPQKPSNDTPMH